MAKLAVQKMSNVLMLLSRAELDEFALAKLSSKSEL